MSVGAAKGPDGSDRGGPGIDLAGEKKSAWLWPVEVVVGAIGGLWLMLTTDRVIAAASIFTAGFVGYQSYLVRETLNSHFESNLQSVQMGACGDFLLASADVRSSYMTWAEAARGESSVLLPEDENYQIILGQLLIRARENSVNLGHSAARLGLVSTEETENQIRSLLSVNTAFLILLERGEPQSTANEALWLDQFDRAFADIRERCRSIMTAGTRGLI